jgi:hypothetical protein
LPRSEFTAEVDDGLLQGIASINYHKEHFGEVFDIAANDADRRPARAWGSVSTASRWPCVGGTATRCTGGRPRCGRC